MIFLFASVLLTVGTASAWHNLALVQLRLMDCDEITTFICSELEKQMNTVQCDNLKQQLNQSVDISQELEVLDRLLNVYKTIVNMSKEGAPMDYSSNYCLNEHDLQKYLHKSERWILLYLPTVIVFVFLGNALVLFAIAKHKDMKIKPNALVLNVAFADILYIVGYSVVEYYRLKWFFVPGERCTFETFRFMIQLFFAGFSGYSVSLLSLMRYLAASGDSRQYLSRQNLTVLISAVWIICGFYAVALSLLLRRPYKQHTEWLIANLIFLYICPMLIVVVTYLETSKIIRRSLKNLQTNHGDLVAEGQRRSRERSGYVTICLSVVFCVSNLSVYLCPWFDCGVNCFVSFEWLFLTNSALNPLALYIGGERFRQHFNEYFYWCFLKISHFVHLGCGLKRTGSRNI